MPPSPKKVSSSGVLMNVLLPLSPMITIATSTMLTVIVWVSLSAPSEAGGAAVGGGPRQVVVVVVAGCGRAREAGRRFEGEPAGQGVDLEGGGVRPADDRIGERKRTVWVGGGHRRHRRRALGYEDAR